MKTLKQFICWLIGCKFDAAVFKTSSLYFCRRCGTELTGRSFDDLEPMSDEEIEQMHRDEDVRQERS